MSQWNPIRHRSLGALERACRTIPLEAWEREDGFELAFAGQPEGWVPYKTFHRRAKQGQQAQMCRCPISGEVWVKPLVGRHRGRDEAELDKRLKVLESLMTEVSGVPPFPAGRDPKWLRVEFTENVLEFELNPPCGCPPKRELTAPPPRAKRAGA